MSDPQSTHSDLDPPVNPSGPDPFTRLEERKNREGQVELDSLAPLSVELQKLLLSIERVDLRKANAEAEIKEQKAANLRAEAAKRRAEATGEKHRAKKEPARQTQALIAGWVRIVLTVIVTLFVLTMLVVSYRAKQPWALPPAFFASLSLYPLRPWEFLTPPKDDKDDSSSSGQ